MDDVTSILLAIEQGDSKVASKLLPLVYEELRKLAYQRMSSERQNHTLQPTALVHEAYLRLVHGDVARPWNSRGHFFAAAAEAMRRILVERARANGSLKRGGALQRIDIEQVALAADDERSDELLALDEALAQLQQHDAQSAELVKLRYFAGLSHQDAADALGIGRRAADRLWALARAWLFRQINER